MKLVVYFIYLPIIGAGNGVQTTVHTVVQRSRVIMGPANFLSRQNPGDVQRERSLNYFAWHLFIGDLSPRLLEIVPPEEETCQPVSFVPKSHVEKKHYYSTAVIRQYIG
jgi:hypothetical protein